MEGYNVCLCACVKISLFYNNQQDESIVPSASSKNTVKLRLSDAQTGVRRTVSALIPMNAKPKPNIAKSMLHKMAYHSLSLCLSPHYFIYVKLCNSLSDFAAIYSC